jgi:hypothetical protein
MGGAILPNPGCRAISLRSVQRTWPAAKLRSSGADSPKGPIELRCLGGFLVTQQYGIGRETSDIDFLSVMAQSPDDNVEVPPAMFRRSQHLNSKCCRREAPVPAEVLLSLVALMDRRPLRFLPCLSRRLPLCEIWDVKQDFDPTIAMSVPAGGAGPRTLQDPWALGLRPRPARTE